MPYASQPQSLEFWTRLQVRLQHEYTSQCGAFQESLKPVSTTVDTADLTLKRMPGARNDVFALLREMENLQLLIMILGGQVRIAQFRANIPDVEAHIACLRNVASLYETGLTNLPRRAPRELELQTAAAQHAALRNNGNGEQVNAERQRLRILSVEVPVVGAEDTADHLRVLRMLHSNIDQQESELQNIRVATRMTLTVPDNLVELVTSFGLDLAFVDASPAPALQEQPAAGEAQQPG